MHIVAMAEYKFEQHTYSIKEERLRQEEQAKREYHNMVMNQQPSQELVSTIAERRSEREEICVLVVEDDLFSRTLVYKTLNKDFVVETASDGREAIEKYMLKAPDIIFAAWCGRPFVPEKMLSRDGWQTIPAVINKHVYEINSSDILQPGPAALTDGINQIHRIIKNWSTQHST